MAWFKFGKKDASIVQDAPVETVETMRNRAKRRLIGALVLVVAAVVGFPLLFDTQPRPVLVDVPIEIPDKNKTKPLSVPAPAPSAAAKVDDKASLAGKEEIISDNKEKITGNKPSAQVNTDVSATKTIANTAPSQDKAALDKTATEKAAQAKALAEKASAEKVAAEKAAAAKVMADKSKAEAAKAQALLEGKTTASPTPAAAANGERFIVQFGSFADSDKAREVRQKVEKVGLKTYAQIAETSEGKRYRVRVGPFATRAEAEKAASKIKSLELPANILTL
jgi:DedD protein